MDVRRAFFPTRYSFFIYLCVVVLLGTFAGGFYLISLGIFNNPNNVVVFFVLVLLSSMGGLLLWHRENKVLYPRIVERIITQGRHHCPQSVKFTATEVVHILVEGGSPNLDDEITFVLKQFYGTRPSNHQYLVRLERACDKLSTLAWQTRKR